ncbi:MAG: hypothetical protein KUG78_08090 [Kangiellaceae bacterium]|nr:hypothetical protein [Kangiellaceae bacterium]
MNWLRIDKFCVTLLLLFSSHFTLANVQDYRYSKAFKVQKLSIEDGLSQSVAQDIIQDENGYIWIATEDGLNRFDSYEFKTYRHDHKDITSLHENWTISLAEEPGKGIWVGTVSGLTFLNFSNQQFKNYSSQASGLRTKIYSLHRSSSGLLYAATDNGLYFYDPKLDRVQPFISREGRKLSKSVDSIGESSQYLYVGSGDCLSRIDKANMSYYDMCDLPALSLLKNQLILAILVQQEIIWLGTQHGLIRYNTKTNEFKKFVHDENDVSSIGNNYVQDLILDKDGSLWVATEDGIDHYNNNTDSFQHYTQQENSDEGLSAKDVVSLLLDDEHLLWLGTYGGGINILDPNQHKFQHVLTKNEVIKLGKNNTIHAITKDRDNRLWLGTYGAGIVALDMLSGDISKPIFDSEELSNGNIFALLHDQHNRLWVGSLSKLSLVDLDRLVEFKTSILVDGVKAFNLGRINGINQDHQGSIFISSGKGLFKVSSVSTYESNVVIKLTNLTHKLPKSYTNYQRSVTTLADDGHGNYWIGGPAGLVYYQVEKDLWTHYDYAPENPLSLSNDSVQVIFEDSRGFIWIGTGDGLNRVVHSSIESDSFYFDRITTYEGLPNNTVYGILEDFHGEIWISTNLGIVKYANDEIMTSAFRSSDGLSSDEFNVGAYYTDSDGRLYFGSINGVTIINNQTDFEGKKKKRTEFTYVRVGERELDMFKLNREKKPSITQRSHESGIDLTVANLSFVKLGTQRYRYRIKGLNSKWTYLGTRRNIFIAGLAEGQYQLEIQSQLAGQSWTAKIKSLDIIVEADFWSSSQAYYLLALVLFSIFAFVLFSLDRKYRNNLSKGSKRIKLESLRVKELRNSNDLLKEKLSERETDIVYLHRQVERFDKQLDDEKFRDVTTGFYRLNFFYKLESEDFLNEEPEMLSNFDCYRNLAIMELGSYTLIHKQLGPIAASELAAQISVVIRQQSDSGIQIFQVNQASFLILGCEVEQNIFEKSLLNLRNRIMYSEYTLANGRSKNTEVSLSLLDMHKLSISSKRELDVAVDFLIQAHLQLTQESQKSCNRIVLNRLINPQALSSSQWQLDKLLDQEFISLYKV